ncbi:MAG: CDP-alcohol phosphatidyltransferase family protein, partial [Gemmatimonadetes bacterium]|nr:CDP-alcohol phosphatidyltransferase family protein [Gemmatimonadota bacterium]
MTRSTHTPATTPALPGLLLVDASRAPASWIVWGMSLTERLRRQGSLGGIDHVVVWVGHSAAEDTVRWRTDLERLHPQRCDLVEEASQLDEILTEHGADGLLVAEGDVVHDDRLLEHLLQQGPGHAIVSDVAAVVWLSQEQWNQRRTSWPDGGSRLLAEGLVCTPLAQIGDYVPELRLTIAPFMIRLTAPDQLRKVDHLMYRRTFKGVIDVVARYGYYHLVRLITRGLSRTTLSPNLFTVLSILGIWVAIPCFATGHIALGCVSAWIGVLLDSVDGKLARLTLNLSDAMGTIEHLSAMPGLGLWFIAIGWHLTSGDLITPSAP